jgi:hypothetical protein
VSESAPALGDVPAPLEESASLTDAVASSLVLVLLFAAGVLAGGSHLRWFATYRDTGSFGDQRAGYELLALANAAAAVAFLAASRAPVVRAARRGSAALSWLAGAFALTALNASLTARDLHLDGSFHPGALDRATDVLAGLAGMAALVLLARLVPRAGGARRPWLVVACAAGVGHELVQASAGLAGGFGTSAIVDELAGLAILLAAVALAASAPHARVPLRRVWLAVALVVLGAGRIMIGVGTHRVDLAVIAHGSLVVGVGYLMVAVACAQVAIERSHAGLNEAAARSTSS